MRTEAPESADVDVEETVNVWPFADGIMAGQVRSLDWASTKLGPIESWPEALRCAVDMVLGCAFPATLQWGPDLLLLYNDVYIPLIGNRHPAALGQPLLRTFPEIRETYQPLAERVLRGHKIDLKDQLFRYSRGGELEDLWFDLSYSPVRNASGEVAGILAIGVDTTARVLAEQARDKADNRLRQVLETDAVGVIFFNYEGYVIDANEVFLRMVGYSRAEIAARAVHWKTMTPAEWVPTSEQEMDKLARTGRIGPYQKEYIMKDGTRRWMIFAGRDMGDGTIAEYAIDITEQKRVERESRAMEERFRALVQASSDVIFRVTPDWKQILQLRTRSFPGDAEAPEQGWLERYIHPEDLTGVQNRIQEAIRTESTFELEHRILRADGSTGWSISRAIPLRNEKGAVIEWFGTSTDVTARKRTEEALLRAEKLATLGRLAASIAHEINNPLEATTNLLYLAQSCEGLPIESRQYLELAEAELKRVAHITRQSLGFYRESGTPLLASINQMLEASIELLRGKIVTKNATVHRQWDSETTIKAVPGELRQVFSNLLSNSLDAIEPGGKIAIRVTQRLLAGTPHVRITFADNGCGIASAKLDSIFDPFYSTKGNLGTGLGLWVTRQIVDKHHGSIRMRSRTSPPHNGTTFSLTFPM